MMIHGITRGSWGPSAACVPPDGGHTQTHTHTVGTTKTILIVHQYLIGGDPQSAEGRGLYLNGAELQYRPPPSIDGPLCWEQHPRNSSFCRSQELVGPLQI